MVEASSERRGCDCGGGEGVDHRIAAVDGSGMSRDPKGSLQWVSTALTVPPRRISFSNLKARSSQFHQQFAGRLGL
jgi:hypothetical protein